MPSATISNYYVPQLINLDSLAKDDLQEDDLLHCAHLHHICDEWKHAHIIYMDKRCPPNTIKDVSSFNWDQEIKLNASRPDNNQITSFEAKLSFPKVKASCGLVILKSK